MESFIVEDAGVSCGKAEGKLETALMSRKSMDGCSTFIPLLTSTES